MAGIDIVLGNFLVRSCSLRGFPRYEDLATASLGCHTVSKMGDTSKKMSTDKETHTHYHYPWLMDLLFLSRPGYMTARADLGQQ